MPIEALYLPFADNAILQSDLHSISSYFYSCRMPEASGQKANGHSRKLDEGSESGVEDVDRDEPAVDEDELSEKSVSVMSEGEAPHTTDLRRKSFFSVRRKRKPSIASEAHLG